MQTENLPVALLLKTISTQPVSDLIGGQEETQMLWWRRVLKSTPNLCIRRQHLWSQSAVDRSAGCAETSYSKNRLNEITQLKLKERPYLLGSILLENPIAYIEETSYFRLWVNQRRGTRAPAMGTQNTRKSRHGRSRRGGVCGPF